MSDIIRIFGPIASVAVAGTIIILRLGLPSWMLPLPFVLMVVAIAWKMDKEITKALLLMVAIVVAIIFGVHFLLVGPLW